MFVYLAAGARGYAEMSWPISNHESPDVDLSIPGVTAPHYLWAILSADRDVRAQRHLVQRCDDAVAGQGRRLQRKKHRPTRWRIAEPPDLLRGELRGCAEPCRGADHGCQRPVADAEYSFLPGAIRSAAASMISTLSISGS